MIIPAIERIHSVLELILAITNNWCAKHNEKPEFCGASKEARKLVGDALKALVATTAVGLGDVRSDEPGAITLQLPVLEVVALGFAHDFDRGDRQSNRAGRRRVFFQPVARVLLEVGLVGVELAFSHRLSPSNSRI